MAEMMPLLTAYTHIPEQVELPVYERHGGYRALKKAILHLTPEAVVEEVKNSGLRGRGGASFPTGLKWSFIPKDPTIAKYLVCNGDESEPGTFKDRYLIEHDPHQLIEGIIIASYAIGAKIAFIYCRGEFYQGLTTLRKAIVEAYTHGYLGDNILGSGYSLDIVLHPGAGAYIAGEETAQLNSLEGYRATPRLKPPFPAIAGLYGKPTVINNVETLCNVIHIINQGAEWFRSIGTPKHTGTKIFQVSGHIQRPGCYEFPLGTSLRDILTAAGGMLPGRQFKACYPGGSSCALLTARDLDIAMDAESLAARNSAIGTASIIVMDDTADMVKVAHRLMEFYQNESCGKCTPCREGTRWVTQILARILAGGGVPRDLDLIQHVCNSMSATSFCPLAVGAAPPVVSAIAEFTSEFEAYILKNAQGSRCHEMKVAYPYLSTV